MNNTGELIKALRKQKGYTQKQLADKAGISRTGLIRYENGETSPSIQTLQLISNALDVDLLAEYKKEIITDYYISIANKAMANDKNSVDCPDTVIFCNSFAHYLMHNRIDVLTCSDTKLMQLFAAFLEQRHK